MTFPEPGVDFVTESTPDGSFSRVRLDRLTDGRIMCCLCFGFFVREQLEPVEGDPDGAVHDVCKGCAESERNPNRRTLRVLVTGSRTWTSADCISMALHDIAAYARAHDRLMVLMHGDCPSGADNIAKLWVMGQNMMAEEDGVARPVREDAYPAAWHNGRTAGIRRNEAMVEAGADVCLAFICDNSRGATHCSNLARSRGIPTVVWSTTAAGSIKGPGMNWARELGL